METPRSGIKESTEEIQALRDKHKPTIGIFGLSSRQVALLNKKLIIEFNRRGLNDDQHIPDIISVGINTHDKEYLKDQAKICLDYGCDILVNTQNVDGERKLLNEIESELGLKHRRIMNCPDGDFDAFIKKVVDEALSMPESKIRRPNLNSATLTAEDLAANLKSDKFLRSRRIEERKRHGGYPILEKEASLGGFAGVLGGAGPGASAEMCLKLAEDTTSFIHCSANIAPGKLRFEEGEGPSYIPYYESVIDFFGQLSPDLFIVPCNTAHKRLFQYAGESKLPVIDIRKAVINGNKDIDQFIILGTPITTGVEDSGNVDGLYEEYRKEHFKPLKQFIVPSLALQKLTTEAIYDVKAGEMNLAREKILTIISELRKEHGDEKWVILGCTELPLPFSDAELIGHRIIDPAQNLATQTKIAILRKSDSLAEPCNSPSLPEAKQALEKMRSKL